MENNLIREKVMKVFPNCDLAKIQDLKVSYLSIEIMNTTKVHSCYLIAFFAKVERAFFLVKVEEFDYLLQLFNYVVEQKREKLVGFEIAMLTVLIQWLNTIRDRMIKGKFYSELEFTEFYYEYFYRRVFRSYDKLDRPVIITIDEEKGEETFDFYMEDIFPLASSCVIMNYDSEVLK